MVHPARALRQTASRAGATWGGCLLAWCSALAACGDADGNSQNIDGVQRQDRLGKQVAASTRIQGREPLLRRGPFRPDVAVRGIVDLSWSSKSVPVAAVRAGMLELARASSEPPRVYVDRGDRGSLTFQGHVPNAFGSDEAAARKLAKAWFARLALGRGLALHERRRDVGAAGDLHLVYGLTLRDPTLGERPLPVWNADLGTHFAPDAALTSLNAAGLRRVTPASEVRFDASAARRIVQRALATRAQGGPVGVSDGEVPLGVWLRDFGDERGGVLSWRVESAPWSQAGPVRMASYVDAGSGAILAHHPLTLSEAPTPAVGSGRDYDGAPLTLQISHAASTGAYDLHDQSTPDRGRVWTYDAKQAAAYTSLDALMLVSSPSSSTWDPAAATAHHNARRVLDYFWSTLGRRSWDGRGGDLSVVVHVGVDWPNATFSSSPTPVLHFGDGGRSGVLETPRCLDVMAHEMGHGVVATTADLVYVGQPGALNESFADVFGALVDRDDWTIGEACTEPTLGFFRSMQTPSLRDQPEHMRDYQVLAFDETGDWGGVHVNSGIPNRAAFLFAQARGREQLEQIWYRTLQGGHLNWSSGFPQMALGTLRACTELAAASRAGTADCSALATAWRSVGIATLDPDDAGGCPAGATSMNGLCVCDADRAPSDDGSACLPIATVQCVEHAELIAGECYCSEGFIDVGNVCTDDPTLCPPNSIYDATQQTCACSEGFEGDPYGRAGGCTAIPSHCPANAHPMRTDDPDADPDGDQCVCNHDYRLDPNTGACVVIPGTCGGETLYGRCVGAQLVYCDDGEIRVADCALDGFVCGLVDTAYGVDCLNPAGTGPGEACTLSGGSTCDDANPICIATSARNTGFCSHECESALDCAAPFGCCGALASGARGCLTAEYCEVAEDPRSTCADVDGGSTFLGACMRDVLVYCDPATGTTRELDCSVTGQVCGFESYESGFNCVDAPPGGGDGGAGDGGAGDGCASSDDGTCDVPARCPEGTDTRDCHPCGTVPASGLCRGATLLVCHPELGLVTSECAHQPASTACSVVDGVAACRAQEAQAGVPDGAIPAVRSAASEAGCATHTGPARCGWLLALLGLLLRRQRRSRRGAARDLTVR